MTTTSELSKVNWLMMSIQLLVDAVNLNKNEVVVLRQRLVELLEALEVNAK